jgi:hypothetical protein
MFYWSWDGVLIVRTVIPLLKIKTNCLIFLINFDEFFYGIYEIWIFACEKCFLKIIKCWNDPIFAIKNPPKNMDFCRTLLEEVE